MQQVDFEQMAVQLVVKIVIKHLDCHFRTKTTKATNRTVRTILENEGYNMRDHHRLIKQLKGN